MLKKPGHPARRCPNNRALLGCESKVKGNMGLYCKGLVEGQPNLVRHCVFSYNGEETASKM